MDPHDRDLEKEKALEEIIGWDASDQYLNDYDGGGEHDDSGGDGGDDGSDGDGGDEGSGGDGEDDGSGSEGEDDRSLTVSKSGEVYILINEASAD